MDFVLIWKRIKPQQRCAFVGTFIFGLISHGMMLFNKFSVHDDLTYMFTGGATFTSGRWMLFILEKIKNFIFQDNIYSLPAINGFFTFLCIGISLCILIDLFEIKSLNCSLLLSGIMISIPVITCMFGYMFIAQFFSLAILLAIAGSYLILKKYKWHFIISGILLMAGSIGIYQSTISIFLSVFLFGLFKLYTNIDSQERRTEANKKLFISLISIIVSILIYLGLMFFFLKINHLELSSYKGMNSFANISPAKYLSRILTAYREFLLPEKEKPYNNYPGGSQAIYICFLIVFLLYLITHIIRTFKNNRDFGKGWYLIVFSLCIPLCINFSFILVDLEFCYSMMFYSQSLLFVFGIWLFEQNKHFLIPKLNRLSALLINTMLFLFCAIFSRFDNVCYTRLEMVQSQTHRYFSSLITRIQNTPGYDEYMPVIYLGVPNVPKWNPTLPEKDEFQYVNIYPYYEYGRIVSDYAWKDYLKFWFSFAPRESTESGFFDLPEVLEMGHYPNDNSIKIIQDTLVIKF